MTYKTLAICALSSVLFLGCAQTAPGLNGSGNVSDSDALSGDTVNIDESSYGSHNSSADGFRSVYFAFGEYGISSSMEASMRKNMQVAGSASAKIKIEGNCDEFGTDEYNYALGLKRAKAVKDRLLTQGVKSSQMVLVSYGESSPVCQDSSDSCYDKNRRVDIRLVR